MYLKCATCFNVKEKSAVGFNVDFPEEPATPGYVYVLSLYYLVVLHLNRVGCKKGSSSLGMSDLPLFVGSLCSAGEHDHVTWLSVEVWSSRLLFFLRKLKLTYRIIRMMFSASVLLWLSCWFQSTGTSGTVLFTVFCCGKSYRDLSLSLFFSVNFFVFNPVVFWLA